MVAKQLKLNGIESGEGLYITLFPSGIEIAKFGIVCSQPYQGKTIKLEINNAWEEIEIGKNGELEIFPDDGVIITNVQVPCNLTCTITYAVE